MTDRELRVDERDMLDALLAIDFPGVAELRLQAGSVRARPGCSCGCPTIELIPAPGTPSAPALGNLPCEAFLDDGGEGALVLLFTRDGRLSELEYAPLGDATPAVFPPAGMLRDLAASLAEPDA